MLWEISFPGLSFSDTDYSAEGHWPPADENEFHSTPTFARSEMADCGEIPVSAPEHAWGSTRAAAWWFCRRPPALNLVSSSFGIPLPWQ